MSSQQDLRPSSTLDVWTSSQLSYEKDNFYIQQVPILKCNSEEMNHFLPAENNKYNNKSNYRHIPHSFRPPYQVARRNARERRRVQSVNAAFSRLHLVVPNEFRERGGVLKDDGKGPTYEDLRARRSSKVTILRRAIDYIKLLEDILSMQNHASAIPYMPET